jgi:16S rRNA (uracil1498-N3)-methyltransferase
MSRFYVEPSSVKENKIYIGKQESHHIVDVMKLRKGDSVIVFDGTGKEYEGNISLIANKAVVVDIARVTNVDKKRPVYISLAQAIPKKDKMDLIIQKASELGVDTIFPFESSRTVVKSKGERRRHKVERWQKIAIGASKQCGRTDLAKVQEITYFETILDWMPRYDLAIMPCVSEKSTLLKDVLNNKNEPNKVLIVIGPEGGFSKGEIGRAKERGAFLVTLGDLVLRSDTAAVATLSILNYEYQGQ